MHFVTPLHWLNHITVWIWFPCPLNFNPLSASTNRIFQWQCYFNMRCDSVFFFRFQLLLIQLKMELVPHHANAMIFSVCTMLMQWVQHAKDDMHFRKLSFFDCYFCKRIVVKWLRKKESNKHSKWKWETYTLEIF